MTYSPHTPCVRPPCVSESSCSEQTPWGWQCLCCKHHHPDGRMTHLGWIEALFSATSTHFYLLGKYGPEQETQYCFSDTNKDWDLVQLYRLVKFSVRLFSKILWEKYPRALYLRWPNFPLPNPALLQSLPPFGTTWPSKQVRFTPGSWEHLPSQERSLNFVLQVTQHQVKLVTPCLSNWVFDLFLDLVPKCYPPIFTQGIGALSVHERQVSLFPADVTVTRNIIY